MIRLRCSLTLKYRAGYGMQGNLTIGSPAESLAFVCISTICVDPQDLFFWKRQIYCAWVAFFLFLQNNYSASYCPVHLWREDAWAVFLVASFGRELNIMEVTKKKAKKSRVKRPCFLRKEDRFFSVLQWNPTESPYKFHRSSSSALKVLNYHQDI